MRKRKQRKTYSSYYKNKEIHEIIIYHIILLCNVLCNEKIMYCAVVYKHLTTETNEKKKQTKKVQLILYYLVLSNIKISVNYTSFLSLRFLNCMDSKVLNSIHSFLYFFYFSLVEMTGNVCFWWKANPFKFFIHTINGRMEGRIQHHDRTYF